MLYVKEVAKAHGMNLTELADKVGINKVTLYHQISDKSDVRLSTLERIAAALNCDISELFINPADHPSVPDASLECPYCHHQLRIVKAEE